MNERWTPGIGDPSVIGWVTVALYLIAAGACAMAARRAMHDARGGTRFWATVAVMMLALFGWQVANEKLYSEAVPKVTLDWDLPGFGRGFAVNVLFRYVRSVRST